MTENHRLRLRALLAADDDHGLGPLTRICALAVVELQVTIPPTGVPEDIKVIHGLDPDLDAQAIKAVSQWRFEPATEHGEPVAVLAEVEVKFRLCCRW